jgi:N-acetylated-alpha-linked acidic dipeptidase
VTIRRLFTLLFLFLLISFSIYFIFFWNRDDLDQYADQLHDLVDGSSLSANLRNFALHPHRAGTPENYRVADRIIRQLHSVGASVWTTEHLVELPNPGKGSLRITFPVVQEVNYFERRLQEDPYTAIADQEQPFFAYIPDSQVEGEVIYANFGDRQDYEYLRKSGVNVAGKIALVRTQGSCRGMKQMIAEEEGLAGILLYPEPRDQGFRKPPYPVGPSLNPWVSQRGSMLKFFLYPGNPYKPNEDCTESTLPSVPALPISSEAAQTILRELKGISNETWKGWMNVPYNSGPGPVRIKLEYNSDRQEKKIRNLFATIGGSNREDPVLMISCHYDAWVYGAADPGSGTAVVLETAKALFELQKYGWKPKRDIVFAFWDAEEYGMMGSTAWVLQNLSYARGEIGNILYVDSVRGPMFRANLVPGMRGLLNEVLQRMKDPNTGKTVQELHLEHGLPGFSDDTIPFSNLAGVPVAQLNYGVHYTMYHSIYDNLAWMERFGDPNYAYMSNLSRILALYSIVLTREDRLPFRFVEFAEYYEKAISKIALEHTGEADLTDDLHDILSILKDLSSLGKRFDEARFNISPEKLQQMNDLLLKAYLIYTEIPGETSVAFRMRNVVVGPSMENECAGVDLPALRRALIEHNPDRLGLELDRLRSAFGRSRDILRTAASLLGSPN